MLRELNDPCILHIFGASVKSGQPLKLICEKSPKGSLHDVLHEKHEVLLMSAKIKIAKNMFQGLLFLHSNVPVLKHENLKSSNVMVRNFSKNSQQQQD
jgi:hypothetical protein